MCEFAHRARTVAVMDRGDTPISGQFGQSDSGLLRETKMSRNTNRGTGTTDERALDEYADYAARAIADAVGGSAKKLAYQVGKSPRTGRRWTRGHRSNPLYRAREIIDRMQNPWPALLDLIVHTARRAIEVGGLVDSEWAWRQAFLEACEQEQERDGEEDSMTQMYMTGRASLADLRNADARHAPLRIRRLALAEIGIREGYTLRDGDDR